MSAPREPVALKLKPGRPVELSTNEVPVVDVAEELGIAEEASADVVADAVGEFDVFVVVDTMEDASDVLVSSSSGEYVNVGGLKLELLGESLSAFARELDRVGTKPALEEVRVLLSSDEVVDSLSDT